MIGSRRLYLLVALLGAVVPSAIAALVDTAPWEPWLWWLSIGLYLGVLGWLRPSAATVAGPRGRPAAGADTPPAPSNSPTRIGNSAVASPCGPSRRADRGR
jgi:hypothetical protein